LQKKKPQKTLNHTNPKNHTSFSSLPRQPLTAPVKKIQREQGRPEASFSLLTKAGRPPLHFQTPFPIIFSKPPLPWKTKPSPNTLLPCSLPRQTRPASPHKSASTVAPSSSPLSQPVPLSPSSADSLSSRRLPWPWENQSERNPHRPSSAVHTPSASYQQQRRSNSAEPASTKPHSSRHLHHRQPKHDAAYRPAAILPPTNDTKRRGRQKLTEEQICSEADLKKRERQIRKQ